MKIALIGPQGSGKTTLGTYLSQTYNLPLVVMGDILRNPDKYPGVRDAMGDFDPYDGTLLDDDRACKIAQIALGGLPDGWILDGLPRKIKQYDIMMASFPPTFFVILDIPRALSIERIQKRSQTNPRKDDTIDILLKRLDLFDKETQPVIEKIKDRKNRQRYIVISPTADTSATSVGKSVTTYIKTLQMHRDVWDKTMMRFGFRSHTNQR